ncbi:MAG: DUF1573 domain-containing protein [Bacteroidia bacterium]
MKRVIILLFFVPALSLAQAKIKFADAKQNFGFVKKGEKVTLVYKFTNEGNQPLVVSEGKAECSCTSVSWTKEPVAPGQTGTVTIVFDTAPTYDRQDRTVEVLSNDPKSPAKIRFKGVVMQK